MGLCTSAHFFQKSYFLEKAIFFGNAIFRVAHFPWIATLLEWLLFTEERLFDNIIFQKRYCFTATITFPIYQLVIKRPAIDNGYSESLGVLSCVSIIAQNHVIDKDYLISINA